MILSMFININASWKRSRVPGNLQLAYEHLTDLEIYFSQKRGLERRNVILFFRLISVCAITIRSLAG